MRRGLVAVTVGVALGAVAVDSARAGEYVMRSCDVPGYANLSMGPWHARADHPNIVVAEDCANGGGIRFSVRGSVEAASGALLGGLSIGRPLTGPQSAIKFVKASLWYSARLKGSGSPLRMISSDAHVDTTVLYEQIMGPPGAENLVYEQALSPSDTSSYDVSLACGSSSPGYSLEPCVPDHAVPFYVRGMEVTLSEDAPPAVLPPVGTLLEDGVQSGVRSLTYAASDPQSGLAKVEVLLGDTVVASHDLTPRCFYSDFTVCPALNDDTLAIDTRAVRNGSYGLVLRVQDAAGNVRAIRGARTVMVFNEPAPESLNALAPYAIVARFNGSSRDTLTVPYGRRVLVRGRLTQGVQPLAAGTPIEVLERLDRPGAHEALMTKVMTEADGSFSIGLATSRPSRTVRLAYRPAGAAEVVSRALKLRVRAASRVRASLRGRVLHFSGRVLSGPVPKVGKRVQMEGRSPGSAWTRFKNVRTDRKGRFSGTYRLRVRRRGVLLKIRAVVPAETGYGYLSARSRAVSLRVR